MLSRKKILGKLFLCSSVRRFQYGFRRASQTAYPPRAEPPIPSTRIFSNLPFTVAAYSLTSQTVSSDVAFKDAFGTKYDSPNFPQFTAFFNVFGDNVSGPFYNYTEKSNDGEGNVVWKKYVSINIQVYDYDENMQINVKINRNVIAAVYFDEAKTQDYIVRGESYQTATVVFTNGLELVMPVAVIENGDKADVYIGFDVNNYVTYGKITTFSGINGTLLQAFTVEIR